MKIMGVNYFQKKTYSRKKPAHILVVSLILCSMVWVGVIGPIAMPHAYAATETEEWGFWRDASFGVTKFLGQLTDDPLDAIGGLFLSLGAQLWKGSANLFMMLSAFVFDEALNYSLDSENFRHQGLINAWTVFRDIVNMAFIFILLYIAIATILQLGNVNTKRMLATLIVVALLINFSRFLTGVVIDAGNILALSFYNMLTDNGTFSLSTVFASQLRIESIFTAGARTALSLTETSFAFGYQGFIFLLSGFIFFAAAFMFVLRTLALIFVLILSPVALAALVLPATKRYFDRWLHQLINQTFFAPVYLLMLIAVLAVMPGMFDKTSSVGHDYAEITSIADSVTKWQIALGFLLIAGLLIGALTLARSMSGGIGTLSVRWAGKLTGLAMAGVGVLGRRTAGRGFQRLSESKWLQKKAEEGKTRVTRVAAGFGRDVGKYGAKATYDVRGLGVTGAAAGGLGTSFGGPRGRGGFKAIEEAQKRRKEERAEELGKEELTREEREKAASSRERLATAEKGFEAAQAKEKTARTTQEIESAKRLAELAARRVKTEKEELAAIEKTRAARGTERKMQYAQRLEQEGGGPLMRGSAKIEVVNKIRKGKSVEEKVWETIKKRAQKDESFKEIFESSRKKEE